MDYTISNFSNFESRIPDGDDRDRMVCRDCHWVHYDNPRVIVTGMCVSDGQILLCRRAIGPRYGFWTLPGGFLEFGETLEEGTCREVREEAMADVRTTSLLATYSIPRIGQIHMIYLAEFNRPDFAPGPESLDVQMFPLTEKGLPWDELAFPVNHWLLRDYLDAGSEVPRQPFVMKPEYFRQKMSTVPFHPDFPPPLESSKENAE